MQVTRRKAELSSGMIDGGYWRLELTRAGNQKSVMYLSICRGLLFARKRKQIFNSLNLSNYFGLLLKAIKASSIVFIPCEYKYWYKDNKFLKPSDMSPLPAAARMAASLSDNRRLKFLVRIEAGLPALFVVIILCRQCRQCRQWNFNRSTPKCKTIFYATPFIQCTDIQYCIE